MCIPCSDPDDIPFSFEPVEQPLPAPWEASLQLLHELGLGSRDQVMALEAEGAAPAILSAAIVRLYRPESFWPRRLPRRLVEADATEDQRLGRSSWALAILERPEPVLACFGHSIMDVFAYRVANLPVEHWLEGRVPPRIDPKVFKAVTGDGFTFQAPRGGLDLTWIRREVRGNLFILDTVGPLRLPHELRCRGRFEVRGAAGVTKLHGIWVKGEAGIAVVEDCPDLVDLELPRTTTVEIRNCLSLRRIRGVVPLCGLKVDGCPQLQQAVLCFPKDTLSRPRIAFLNCPSLVRMESTSRARRVIGDLILVGCTSLHPPVPPLVVMGRVEIQSGPEVGNVR